MPNDRPNRRTFLTGLASAAALSAPAEAVARAARGRSIREESGGQARPNPAPGKIRFAAIGLNHGHINGQTNTMLEGGGELVWVFAKEPDLLAAYTKRFPQAKVARSEDEILQDPSIHLVISAAIPIERAPLGIRVMQHGKDYMADKAGVVTLDQLAEVRRVQAKTGRIYSIFYGERLENRATVKAGELVKDGAIGRVIQTVGLGPHRLNAKSRPAWFFDKEQYGGILCDIGSHQAEQFLFFTGSTSAEVAASQVGNYNHPQYPELEDFGDALVRGNGGTGYLRVDWFTPGGLQTWGDGRLTILGTDGYIEIRKNIDITGRPGGNHLFLVDGKATRHIDCSNVHLPYGEQLVHDVLHRTETAMTQAHCFLATELILKAQQGAKRVTTDKG